MENILWALAKNLQNNKERAQDSLAVLIPAQFQLPSTQLNSSGDSRWGNRQSRSVLTIAVQAKAMAIFPNHHLEPVVLSTAENTWGHTVQIYIL